MDVHPISIVGAGPGHAALLTVRAAELVRTADVLLHPAGGGGDLLALGAPGVERHAVEDAQAAAALALEAAARGARVAWLVPGDPGSSPEGAAAVRALTARGAAPEIVPGVAVDAADTSLGALLRRKPLLGRRVVVTRPRAQAAGFVEWLASQGAEPVLFPAIRIVPPPDPAPLAAAAAAVRGFDWVVFTSVNGVERFWSALEAEGVDARALSGARLAAIGPATADALLQHGLRADLVPPRYVAESVVAALAAADELRGRRVLLPRAAGARDVLPRELEGLGARVTEVEAYRSVSDTGAAEALRGRLGRQEIDAVTFTSSSTVSNFVEAIGADVGRALVACIGPITAATAARLGVRVDLVAEEHTVPGLQAVLVRHFAGH